MTVTHNNKLYRVTPLYGGVWLLTDVDNPRNKVILNRRQMIISGLGHAMEGK